MQENIDTMTVPKYRILVHSVSERSAFKDDMRDTSGCKCEENIPEDKTISLGAQFLSQVGDSEIRENRLVCHNTVALQRDEQQRRQLLSTPSIAFHPLLGIAHFSKVSLPGLAAGFSRVQTGTQEPRLLRSWQDN
jgi:hypothetical protein